MKLVSLLSHIAFYRTYAAVKPDGTKETPEEVITRYENDLFKKYPSIQENIKECVNEIRTGRVLPSMRMLQFAGLAVEKENLRGYNCSFSAIVDFQSIRDILYLSACGVGCGFSVQRHHVNQLPIIKRGKSQEVVILDSREAWADSIETLLVNPMVTFDYSLIRKAGTPLSTGGFASGPEPLIETHNTIREILKNACARKLRPIEVHSIICAIANGIVSGGVRRSALISLFDKNDKEMLECKSGEWWVKNPHFARANISAVLVHGETTEEEFWQVYNACIASQAGEPGIYWTYDKEFGTNPCCLSLNSNLLTPKGIQPLSKIQEGDIIWSGEKWTKVLKKWKTGTKMVYRYETNAGYFLGTADHNVYQHDKKIRVDQADGIDRCLGPVEKATEINPQDVMNGLLIGDGSVHKASNNLIGLFIGDKDGDYHTSEIAHLIKMHRPGVSPKFWTVETDLPAESFAKVETRVIPDRYFYGSINQKVAFLRGLFSANGCVTANRVQYKTACKTQAQQIQTMLSSLGIKSSMVTNKPATINHHNGTYTSKESYNLIIYNHSEEFMANIGFLQKYKMEQTVKNSKQRNIVSEIKNVIEIGEEEVYDIMVEDVKHRFWCDGLLVSNCEISLKSRQLCNLTEVVVSNCANWEEFKRAVMAATVLGTLQAGYTDFNYVHPDWKKNCEEDALLGVSITGQAQNWDLLKHPEFPHLASYMKEINKQVAAEIGINPAARIGTVKPSGTSSTVMDCSSGIHANHAEYYLRRIRILKTDPLAIYLVKELPSEFVEYNPYEPNDVIIGVPVHREGFNRHTESAIELLERVRYIKNNWINPSHVSGPNTHNVSVTVSYKSEEVEKIGKWMWQNRKNYNGISLLPMTTGTYDYAPYKDITKEKYEELIAKLPLLDLSQVVYSSKDDGRSATSGCEGTLCELK